MRSAWKYTLLALLCCGIATAADDFPLTIHIVKVDMAQANAGVYGSGNTDENGKYSSQVSGGESYLYHLFTTRIDGDNRELILTTPRMHSKGGRGLAAATLGWSAVATGRHNAILHIGDYRGRWNKNGSLEISFTDERGHLKHQTFTIQAERPIEELRR